MKIEFIKAHEDGMWSTEVIDVPDDGPFEGGTSNGDECPNCMSGTMSIERGLLVCQGECGQLEKPIPFTSSEWDSAIIAYCHKKLATQSQHRKIVYWGIYNNEPEADAEVPKLIIRQHTDPEDGRKDLDNLGTMVCWHGRYNLGDKQPGGDPLSWERNHVPDDSVVLKLYLLDHSGITMSCEDFNDQWDSGQVGIIFASPEKIKEEYGDFSIASCDKAREVLLAEVKEYDLYLRGEVWGYKFGDDSCWGFIGDTLEETGLEDQIPEEAQDQLEEAWEARQ